MAELNLSSKNIEISNDVKSINNKCSKKEKKSKKTMGGNTNSTNYLEVSSLDEEILATIKKLEICLIKIILKAETDSVYNTFNYNDFTELSSNPSLAPTTTDSQVSPNSSVFDLKAVPNISLFNYVKNVCFYSKITNKSTIISALMLLDRFLNSSSFNLNKFNVHIVLFIGLCISIKMNEDLILNDKSLAMLGMIDIKSYKFYESYFLSSINYNSLVNYEEYKIYESMF